MIGRTKEQVAVSASPQQPSAHPNFPAMELEILKFWEQDDTFQASVDNRPAGENGSN